MTDSNGTLTWEKYFTRENRSFFQNLLSFHRKIFISRAVKFYTDKYFHRQGFFVEAGAGTSQSSSRIRKLGRKLIALDLNHYVLARHNILAHKVQGDILSLPFKSKSLDGIWNLGVMEHLTDEDIVRTLKEFKRVMKDDAVLLLLWPPYFAPFQIFLKSIQWVLLTFLHKKVEFFPCEINLYRTKTRLKSFLDQAGFKLTGLNFNVLDLFSYIIVVARK